MRACQSGKRSRRAAITGAIFTMFGRVPRTWRMRIGRGGYAAGSAGERVDLLGELEVVGGQPARRMRCDRHSDLAPGDREVRMVIHVLRRLNHLVDEVDRPDEVRELEGLRDRVPIALPSIELGKPGRDVVLCKALHGTELI